MRGEGLLAEEVVAVLPEEDEGEEDEDADHGENFHAFAGLFAVFDGVFDGFLFGEGDAFVHAGLADLGSVVGLVEFVEGSHAAAIGAACFGDGVPGFVDAVAVFAPVSDGVFEASVSAEVFAALAAAFAAGFVVGLELGEVDGVVGVAGDLHCGGIIRCVLLAGICGIGVRRGWRC